MPMVGGRAAEYAGWWSGGLNISITNRTTITDTVYRTPTYSLLQGDATPQAGIVIPSTGNINLTGYSSLGGFSDIKSITVWTVYLDWPTSGIPSTDPVSATWANQLTTTGLSYYYNPAFRLVNNNTQLEVQASVPNTSITITMPGSYTTYVGRWITLTTSTSNTSALYTSWAGGNPGGNNLAGRLCLFDTVTGERLYKADAWINIAPPPISGLPTTLPMGGSATDKLETNFFGSSVGPTQYKFRLGNAWFAAGTTFDPVGQTNTSWRTSRPSSTFTDATYGDAQAWFNLQTNNYASPSSYYVSASGMDRYSETNNYISQGYSSSDWTNMYSTSIILKDSS